METMDVTVGEFVTLAVIVELGVTVTTGEGEKLEVMEGEKVTV